MSEKTFKLKKFLKASRADFLPACIIPFCIGAAFAYNRGFPVPLSKFMLGLIGVMSAHLSANLINNYYDYKSGADTQTPKISTFFGGSKAIEEGDYTAQQIFQFAIIFLIIALLCGLGIFIISKNSMFLWASIIVGFLAIEYTAPPLKFAYNRLGELDIFCLFGVGLVMGSFYIFSETLMFSAFLISLPIAFLVVSVIICNEIPDFKTDINVKKFNLLSLTGIENGYILYGAMLVLSFFSLLLNIQAQILPFIAVISFLLYCLGLKTMTILKNDLNNPQKLIQSSFLTILQHALVGISLIIFLLV